MNVTPCCASNAVGNTTHSPECPSRFGELLGGSVPHGQEFDKRQAMLRDQMVKDAAKRRRERIATAVLAGFAGNAHSSAPWMSEHSDVNAVQESVRWADALIAELDK